LRSLRGENIRGRTVIQDNHVVDVTGSKNDLILAVNSKVAPSMEVSVEISGGDFNRNVPFAHVTIKHQLLTALKQWKTIPCCCEWLWSTATWANGTFPLKSPSIKEYL